MSFKLAIRLDRPDGIYLAGDTISGVVSVIDPDGGRGKIQLIREWRAHGRGAGDLGSRDEMTIAETWSAGTSEIPFSFTMPDGPFTYRGTNTNVDWYVRAESGGLLNKTRAETDFIFGAVPNMPNVNFGPAYTAPVGYGAPSDSSVPPMVAVGISLAVLAVIISFFMYAQLPSFIWIPIIAIFTGGFGYITYTLIRNNLAKARLGDVQLEIEPLVLQSNNNVQIRFSTVVKANVDLEKIEVKLLGNETWVTGNGTSRTTHTAPMHQAIVPISEARSVRAGEKLEFSLEVPIPDGAATTFCANCNKITWQVVVTIPLKGWSDWQHIQEITVRP